MSKINNQEIEELEKDFEKELTGHFRPINESKWIPYEEFKKKIKVEKKDKIMREFEKDLIKEQKKEQKQLLKEIKKLSKELAMTKIYRDIKKVNKEFKFTEKNLKLTKSKKDVKAYYENKYSLKLNEKSNFKMKTMLGEIFNYEPNVNLNTNMETVNIISSTIFDSYLKVISKFKYLYKQGIKGIVKLTFINGTNDTTRFSTTIRDGIISTESIKKTIVEKVINRFIGGESEFSAVFDSVTYFIFPLSVKGGCSTCLKLVEKLKYKDRTIKLISPKSSNDNCLFMCFVYFLNLKGNTLRFDEIRKELKLKEGKINFKDVSKVAKYFNVGYVLLNQNQEIISHLKLETKPKIHIMLMNEHYFIVEYIDYKKCEQCGKQLLLNNETHECSNKKTTYWKSRICKKREFVDMIDCSDKEKISKDSMVFFDLETFQETVSHVPYACGFSYGNHKNVDISYGKNCMDKFLEHISKVENKNICAYNGSGFDFYILIDYLKDKNIPIKNLILSNGAILSFKFGEEGKENKFFDLYRFIISSLDKACQAYKIEKKN